MIFGRETNIGLAALVARMQKRLHDELNKDWNLINPGDATDTSKFLQAYGICYVIKKEDKNEVTYYAGKNENPTISVAEENKFFFLHRMKSIKDDARNYKSEIELIFIVDLEKLKPTILHRADLEVQNDVELYLQQFDNVWIKSLDSGYVNALNGISYEQKNDVQPFHVFKFTLGIRYDMDDEC